MTLNWKAAEESGVILGFKDKPRVSRKSSWGMGCNGWYTATIGTCRLDNGNLVKPDDWTKTLVRI